MNGVPEPADYSEKEVFAFFGLASYSAQVLEKGLVNMVVAFKTFGLRITRVQFDEIFEAHDSRTLGQLLRTARDQNIPIPQETDELLARALRDRNSLNHDFFAEHAGHFVSEQGRETMIKRLRALIVLFEDATRRCDPIYLPLLERMGVTEESMKKATQELIGRAELDN